MTKPKYLHKLHERHVAMATRIGPHVMPIAESIEAACRHVVEKDNSLSRIFALAGFSPNHELRALYAFLLLRHPKLRLSHAWVAEYFLTEVEQVKDYEASGALMLMGAAPSAACARLILVCTLLGIKGHELVTNTS